MVQSKSRLVQRYSQPVTAQDDSPAREELTGSDLFDYFGSMEMDMMDLSGMDRAYVNAMEDAVGTQASRPYEANPMQQGELASDFSLPNMSLASVNLPKTTQEIPASLPTLDPFGPPIHASRQPASHNSSPGASTSAMPSTASLATSREISPSTCSCTQDTVRVVQQLEDDEFQITTLTLDKVLQLQKRLISQCSSTLNCPSCRSPGEVQTVLLIICDRLAEMFECIHRRLQKLGQRIAARSHVRFPLLTPPGQEQPGAVASSGQLFCGTSGGYASNAECNPGLFLPAMQAMYSEQEQVHLIKALLGLQMDNFQELLDRVSRAGQASISQARRLKIRSQMARLSRARTDIDNASQALLQLFPTISRTEL
ncbi:hypothetical protein VPNG_00853 [Cytospora leucostoma]|uniref:Aflatoxin regulatory protein domain-containing protein n=1 Tax=Cytospora leucostoma TaxID=1230097 RepID=A0A423XMA3_9PEZI|nr:hypothetical protein VPNG_00853 [Cytospora leucostoma]